MNIEQICEQSERRMQMAADLTRERDALQAKLDALQDRFDAYRDNNESPVSVVVNELDRLNTTVARVRSYVTASLEPEYESGYGKGVVAVASAVLRIVDGEAEA